MQKSHNYISSRLQFNKCKIADSDPHEEIKTIVTVKHHFDYRDIFFSLNNSLEILGYQGFHARIKIHSLSIKKYRRRRGSELRTETFVEEIRRLVTVKIDVEYQQKSKKLKKSISGSVRVYDGTNQMTKI